MELFFTSPAQTDAELRKIYIRVFREAAELYLVSAYLTAWPDDTPRLNAACNGLTIIVGKDFGITRKAACEFLVDWLPKKFLSNFLVADGIAGFHPKALFWKDRRGRHHMLVGSSNMTEAAMSGNVEANVYRLITREEFDRARLWIAALTKRSVPVAGGWLDKYKEAPRWSSGSGSRQKREAVEKEGAPVMPLTLPNPVAGNKMIKARRQQIADFQPNKDPLLKVFGKRVAEKINNNDVYARMQDLWGSTSFQTQGWARTGKKSNWQAFSRAFLAVCEASDSERDGVVQSQLDWLAEKKYRHGGPRLRNCYVFIFRICIPC